MVATNGDVKRQAEKITPIPPTTLIPVRSEMQLLSVLQSLLDVRLAKLTTSSYSKKNTSQRGVSKQSIILARQALP